MATGFNLKSISAASLLCSAALLAGCSTGTTYGTGVSQETQLLSDLGSIVAITSAKERKRINYNSRATLVKPPADASLPAPVETNVSEDGYFPTNPEERRLQNIKRAEVADPRSGEISLEEMKRKKVDGPIDSARPAVDPVYARNREQSADENLRQSREVRQRVLAERSANRIAQSTSPRRYLTEPPREYRTPAETAPVGVVGEEEKNPNVKKKSLVGGDWF